MKETWKPIPNYEGYYEASSLGRIRSVPRFGTKKNGSILKPNVKKSGYVNILLSKNNVHKTWRLHRLIAQAFIPNPENKPQVNHKNGDKSDNRVDNLEWVTVSENMRHKFEVLGYKMPQGKGRPIMCVETGEVFEHIKDAERKYGKSYGAILHVIHGKSKTAYNLHWVLAGDTIKFK